MAAVAVTEPDFSNGVASIKITEILPLGADAPGYVINGVKTWCTFGARPTC
jgi:(2S)-methylsuccinyl-CoA dehydrogenase